MTAITARIVVPHDHPSLAGHFPGRPIVPGVVLLDAVLTTIRSSSQPPLTLAAIVSTKFLRAVAPDTPLELTIELAAREPGHWKARFIAQHEGATMLEGSFLLSDSARDGAL